MVFYARGLADGEPAKPPLGFARGPPLGFARGPVCSFSRMTSAVGEPAELPLGLRALRPSEAEAGVFMEGSGGRAKPRPVDEQIVGIESVFSLFKYSHPKAGSSSVPS